MGRPTKLNKDVTERICAALLAGNTIVASAAYGGIHYDTLNRWRLMGEKAGKGPYYEFSEAIKNAINESEALIISEIRAHGKKQWVALAWIAERRWPERWARRERIEHTGKDGGPIEHVDYSKLSYEELQKIASRRKSSDEE